MLILVAGASGQHAAVVYEAALLSNMDVVGFATVDRAEPEPMLDCPWLGSVDAIMGSAIARGERFVVACGSNVLRRQQTEALQAAGAALQSVHHPHATVSPSASIGPGSTLLAGSIVGPRAVLGRGVVLNHGASVDHDCEVGDYCNISPGARFAGHVQAERGVFAGLNASVLPGLRLGEDAVIGAGAVVTRDVPPGQTVFGVPARRVGAGEMA